MPNYEQRGLIGTKRNYKCRRCGDRFILYLPYRTRLERPLCRHCEALEPHRGLLLAARE